MLQIERYIRAETPAQAYELCQKKSNVILGGMLWLKQQNRRVSTAIDLCGLGLDKIEETEDFKSSKPTSIIKNETISADIYSNLPCPYG